jgi:nucleoside-triphosphatase THEP1
LSRLNPPAPITAVAYSDGNDVEALIRAVADHLIDQGLALAGLVQRSRPRTDRRRCDMILEELASGEHVAISEDRGSHARGCMLAMDALLRAAALATRALEAGPDLLIVNKFGKTEGQGGGFRPLIAEALVRNVPVLIAVPYRNLDGWRRYTEGFAINHPIEGLARDAATVCGQLGLAMAAADNVGRTMTATGRFSRRERPQR